MPRGSRSRSAETAEKTSAEYLVFDIGSGAKVGGSYALVGVEKSLKAAEALVKALPSASASKVAILERKAVLMRKPAIELHSVSERVVSDKV